MRIVGIGLDLTEIDRFSDLIQKEAFLKKYYVAKERELIAAKGVQAAQTAAVPLLRTSSRRFLIRHACVS